MNQLPNILSITRFVISPVFFLLLISENPKFICMSLPIYLFAAVTDYLDGWIARRMKVVTKFGKIFDPLADKFLTDLAFLAFAVLSILPLWMVLIIIFRDVLTTVMRFFPSLTQKPLVTSNTAKIKTFIQMFFIFIILVCIFLVNCPVSQINPEVLTGFLYSGFIYYSMLLIVILTLWTLGEYAVNYRNSQ